MASSSPPDRVTETVSAFSEALRSISPSWVSQYRVTRRFLTRDPMERMVPEKLIFEGVEQQLSQISKPHSPFFVFMNRGGHGDGARLAAGLLPIIAKHWGETTLVHVSFNTPEGGLGALVRNLLKKEGANHGIEAHAVAHNRPAQGLKLSDEDVKKLLGEANMVVSLASLGEAGLVPVDSMFELDPLIAASHLSVLAYPDPEGLLAEMSHFKAAIDKEPNVDAVRFWVQVLESDGKYEDLETVLMDGDSDVTKMLWPLIENARRRPYRILVEPLLKNRSAGAPLVCPGRSVIERSLEPSAMLQKIVPAGSSLIAVSKGRHTFTPANHGL